MPTIYKRINRESIAEIKRKQFIGKRFSKLVVINWVVEKNKSGKNVSKYNCICDCGNYIAVFKDNLINGNTKSCGCVGLSEEARINKARLKVKKGSRLKTLYNSYKRRAKERGYSFLLDLHLFEVLTSSNCVYCSSSPAQISRSSKNKYLGDEYVYNGIDRKDSSLGYTVENSFSCCYQCNTMKLDYTEEEFIEKIIKIYNHYILGKQETLKIIKELL